MAEVYEISQAFSGNASPLRIINFFRYLDYSTILWILLFDFYSRISLTEATWDIKYFRHRENNFLYCYEPCLPDVHWVID